MMPDRITAAWLRRPSLQKLLAALSGSDEEARVVGGAIRNTLLELAIADIDIATSALPSATMERAKQAGFKAVPTGIEHGTVTVVTPDGVFEVTTLRSDVETDGRHARVRFGHDWQADAERRDFTINALYCDADGAILDLVGGMRDMETRTLRFIGEASRRIEEDYLRILRFFRFFAWYGTGRPDGEGLRASARLKGRLALLSAERVWSELRKLLEAPDPSRALLWMRQTGVLSAILPESERWGIDAIHGLVVAERRFSWAADPLLRLASLVPPDPERIEPMTKRLRMSNADRDRLMRFAETAPVAMDDEDAALRRRLYFEDRRALIDHLRLSTASALGRGSADDAAAMPVLAAWQRLLGRAESFQAPPFPVSGEDLLKAGVAPGPELGKRLDRLRLIWVDSGFVLSRARLLDALSVLDTQRT